MPPEQQEVLFNNPLGCFTHRKVFINQKNLLFVSGNVTVIHEKHQRNISVLRCQGLFLEVYLTVCVLRVRSLIVETEKRSIL